MDSDREPEKCESCGLIAGHANHCYANVLVSRLVALEDVVLHAKILLEAPTNQEKLVAMWKLEAAVTAVDRIERRQALKV